MPADETFVTSVVETFSDTVTASVVTIGVGTFSDTVIAASVVTIVVRYSGVVGCITGFVCVVVICDALSVVVTSSVIVTNSVTVNLSGASVTSVVTIVVGDLMVAGCITGFVCVCWNL